MSATQTIRCPSCGAVNRVEEQKLHEGLAPVCGRCKSPLTGGASPIVVTDANFTEIVERSPLPVLVDFWAPWCGPCRMVAPIVEQLAGEMAGKIRFGKLNTDENPLTASRFHIEGIPALLLFREGKEVDRMVGAYPKPAIAQRLAQVFG